MSLDTLTWRELPTQTVSTATVDAYLTAIAAAVASTTYKDGSARTPGSGAAWSRTTSGSPVESIVLTDPSSAIDSKVLIAGKSAATPKMLSPDTWLANALHVGHGPDGGTVTTWDGTGTNDPLGAGKRFSGYTRFSAACTGGTGFVVVIESAEGLAIVVKIGASWYGVLINALIDPQSTAAARCEADGRVYALFTTSSTALSSAFDSTNVGFLVGHSGTAGSNHCYYLVPRTSTWRAVQRIAYRISAAASGTYKAADGAFVLPDIQVEDTSTDNWIGVLREICRGPRRRMRQDLYSDGALFAHQIAGSDSADADTVYLLR